jgi:hypothetical protein
MSLRSIIFKQAEYITSIFDIRFFRVSFSIRLDARGQRRRLYETLPERNSEQIVRRTYGPIYAQQLIRFSDAYSGRYR